MIRIADKPFKPSDLQPSDSIEKIILQRLNEYPTVYSYQSIAELSFELKLRKSIIESAKAMNRSNVQFATFATSRGNPHYWNLTSFGGFRLGRNVKPSDAIQDIYSNSSWYAFECATAMIVIYYHAILNLIGADLFNRLFQNIYLYSWHADSDLGLTALTTPDYIPGDVVYFDNPDFNPQTPQWRGENAVVLEDDTYFGHGIGIKTAEQMIVDLNKRRKLWSNRTAYLSKIVARPSFSHLSNVSKAQQIYVMPKYQQLVVHHNDSSISVDQYLFL